MRSFSTRSLRCKRLSLKPHTIRSHSMSSRDCPKAQCSESFRSSATNVATFSLCCLVRELKLYRWTITDGFGLWCLSTRSTSCANVRSVGFTGARMFHITWYVVGPHTLSRMARCLSADVTSLAVKYWASRSEYDCQSSRLLSNLPTVLCIAILEFILVANIVFEPV